MLLLASVCYGYCCCYSQLSLEANDADGRQRLRLSAPGMEDAFVTLDERLPAKTLDIFGETCRGTDLGDEASAWLASFVLGPESARAPRLFWHSGEASSRVDHPRRTDGSDRRRLEGHPTGRRPALRR